MSQILFYTLCSMLCAAVNDLLFKYFARKERSRGLFVTFVGISGTVLMFFIPDKFTGDIHATLLWGTICGFFSLVGNILLIESMSSLSAGVCSTIYRLNLALAVPLSVFFFNEKLNVQQYIGILLAISAVLLFISKNNSAGTANNINRKTFIIAMAMIIMASVFRAGLGISCKYAPIAGASPNGVQLIIMIMWVIGGIIYYSCKEWKHEKINAKIIGYGIASGILVAGILFFMLQALKYKDAHASIVLPIMQMSFIFTFLLSVIFLKEKVSLPKCLALLCGISAMILLSITF